MHLDRKRLLPIWDWAAQRLMFQPERISISTAIRTVADMSGGVHVDSTVSAELRLMHAQTPAW